MGSYESLRDTVQILRNVIWRCTGVGDGYDPLMAYYFDFLLRRFHPRWYADTGAVAPPVSKPTRRTGASKRIIRLVSYPWFAFRGTKLIWPGAPRFDVRQYPAFPNPHIRSNGFMVRRDRWLEVSFAPKEKGDANLFESGPLSLTTRMRERGLSAMVVGADGNGYDVSEWPRSRTFRLAHQANLLVRDNHTRAFEEMSAGARVTHGWLTWGESLQPLPPGFPTMGAKLQAY
jgi:hypothetical protein